MPTGTLTVRLSKGADRFDELLGFGARANAKRGFLFVSKILAKHWPVTPRTVMAIHDELAAQIPADLPGPIVFIAMAETAVGLGQGVFEAFLRLKPAQPALFIHSTRYPIDNCEQLEFAETHSHAPRQFLHLPADVQLVDLFKQARSLVLIDDEASTGNTFVNLARACKAVCGQLSHLHLCTPANFMSPQAKSACSEIFGLSTTLGALIEGHFEFSPAPMSIEAPAAQVCGNFHPQSVSTAFGRVGTAQAIDVPQLLAIQLSADIEPDAKILVLGTGEFMHLPFLLGLCLEQLGHAVWVQSTTRSPILTWGAIHHAHSFSDNYGEGVPNYLYNVTPGLYDEIFICHETQENDELRALAKMLGARLIQCK
jgi:hypothetical protein